MRIRAPAFFAVTVLLLALLSGCGQKGALFLPEAEDGAEAVMVPATPADEEAVTEPDTDEDQDP